MRTKTTLTPFVTSRGGRLRIVFLAFGLVLCAATVPSASAQFPAQLLSTRSTALPLAAGGNSDSINPRLSPDGRFILFESAATDLVPGTGAQLYIQVYLRDRASNTTTLVSVNLRGFGGSGNSTAGALSPDVRYVAFASEAGDLVAGHTNTTSDIFVRDLIAGTTTLVSVSNNGLNGDGPSTSPAITPDGRYVAFLSTANNVGPSTGAILPLIYVRDLVANTTVAASPGASYGMYFGVMSFSSDLTSPPSITPNGRYVAFASILSGLIPGMFELPGDVFVRDLVANQTIWASSNASAIARTVLGGSPNQTSQHPIISDDGAVVTFKTGNSNAVVLQYNLTNGSTAMVFTNALLAGEPFGGTFSADDFFGPEATPDGRFVALVATEAPDSNGTKFGSLRLWDRQTGTNVLVSANTNGVYSPGTLSYAPALTPDGRYVVFLSNAGDLTTNSVSSGFHVFLRDVVAGTTTLVDASTNGIGSPDTGPTGVAEMVPAISTNGQFIAFSEPDGGLVVLDNNGAEDVFVQDRTAGTTQLISQHNPAVLLRSGAAASASGASSASADGRWVAFASYAANLVPNDTNTLQDVFVCDRWSGSNTLVSVALTGGSALGGQSLNPLISTNGQYVFFLSAATNLTADVITNHGTYNIFRRDLVGQTTVLVTLNTNGTTSADHSSASPAISQDGRYVAFYSLAHNLAKGTSVNGGYFWRDISNAVTVAFFTNGTLNYPQPFPPSLSVDGRYVAYPAPLNTSGAPAVVQVWDSTLSKNLFTNATTYAVISPDGSRLLYETNGSALTGSSAVVHDLIHGTNMLSLARPVRTGPIGAFSGNGRFVAVASPSPISLVQNTIGQIYLCDLLTPTQMLVSINYSLTGGGNATSDSPALSSDGRYVAFRSFANNLVPGHTNAPDLYLFDSATGTNALLTTDQPTSELIAWPTQPYLSVDGSTAVFQSFGSGLSFGDANRAQDVFAAVLPYAAIADTDGDGIPDYWMIEYFGHITAQAFDQSLASDDPNGTGMTTLQDYIAGNNPTDPTSTFQVAVNPALAPGGNLTLTWSAIPNRNYSIQYKDNVTDPAWQPLAGTPTIIGAQGQFSILADQGNRFYRIVVQ